MGLVVEWKLLPLYQCSADPNEPEVYGKLVSGDWDSSAFNLLEMSKSPWGTSPQTEISGVKLSDGKRLKRTGILSDSLIDKMPDYYGKAIRNYCNDVNAMLKAVWAIRFRGYRPINPHRINFAMHQLIQHHVESKSLVKKRKLNDADTLRIKKAEIAIQQFKKEARTLRKRKRLKLEDPDEDQNLEETMNSYSCGGNTSKVLSRICKGL
ncbi:hypothetical protein J6590_040194 [Homalodisca vitripennis]|nr:hypothetical protein J6590_040194 [Homalodisca vitripennis]